MLHRSAVVAMTEVAARALRDDTSGLVRRVTAGERIVITVNGRPTAQLSAIDGEEQRTWLPRAEVARRLLTARADAAQRADLERLTGHTTEELGGP